MEMAGVWSRGRLATAVLLSWWTLAYGEPRAQHLQVNLV